MNTRGIIIAVAVLVTVSTIALIYLSYENNITEQKQAEKLLARIHHLTDNGTKYVRINDLSPNSAIFFNYPYSGNNTQDDSMYNRWILIRLSKNLGGDKEDIFSFRAYSALDIANGCSLRYIPQNEKLSEPCHDDTFESVNGIAIAGDPIKNKYKALPNLDLGVDEDGYIFVKPPTFEFNKNGVIGAGRIVQNDSQR